MTTTTAGGPDPSGSVPGEPAETGSIASRDRNEATGPASDRPHFPAFEGLRALAAVMVVVHHAASLAGDAHAGVLATPARVMDGGVAIFFVLSGFLIYRPFVTAHVAGRSPLPLRSFWWRRALRIVPAYWAALTFFWLLGSYHLGPGWWRYYLFVNIYDRYTALGGIVQAWSLCTEMTFYLLVPFWAALLRRLVPATKAVPAQLAGCALLAAGGYVSRAAMPTDQPRFGQAFLWLPTNIDLFAVGMAVAVVSVWAGTAPAVRARLDRAATVAEAWWAAALALFLWYAYRVGASDRNGNPGYVGWYWQQRQLTLSVLGILLLVPAVFGPQDRGPARRVATWRPIVWLGSVSYGLYLWHLDWMKRVTASTNPPWPGWAHDPFGNTPVLPVLAVGLGVGTLFAALSWDLLERPLQRFKGRL